MRVAVSRYLSLSTCVRSEQVTAMVDDALNALFDAQVCNLGDDWVLEDVKITHPRDDRVLIVVVGSSGSLADLARLAVASQEERKNEELEPCWKEDLAQDAVQCGLVARVG